MSKLNTLVGGELSVIKKNIIVIGIKYLPETKLSETLKYH